MSNWIIFYVTLLSWEFLLKWYNFFWNFCWNRDFLLCTTISIGINSQFSFPLCKGVGNFGKVGVGYFTFDSSTLVEVTHILTTCPYFDNLKFDRWSSSVRESGLTASSPVSDVSAPTCTTGVWLHLRPVSMAQKNKPPTMSSSNDRSVDLLMDGTAWRFRIMRQSNGCSTPAPRSTAASWEISICPLTSWCKSSHQFSDFYSRSTGTKLAYQITLTEWLKSPNIRYHCNYDSNVFTALT